MNTSAYVFIEEFLLDNIYVDFMNNMC